jgi:bacterioferritin (cytochrome b1)
MVMTATEQGIDCLNSLLRGELAATETYQQAIAKIDGSSFTGRLRRMHIDHREAANTLRQHIHQCGGLPAQGSGPWGAWAKTVEGTAKLFGKVAALKALKEGEEQGITDYDAALNESGLSPECRMLIRAQLLPQTREHINALERMLAAAER